VRFLVCRARRNDAEWSFHSKELQRSYALQNVANMLGKQFLPVIDYIGHAAMP